MMKELLPLPPSEAAKSLLQLHLRMHGKWLETEPPSPKAAKSNWGIFTFLNFHIKMLFFKKVIILFLTVAAMIAAYFIHDFLKKKINPRKSFGHFFLFLFANLISIFGLVFLLSVLLLKFKEFFFKGWPHTNLQIHRDSWNKYFLILRVLFLPTIFTTYFVHHTS